LSGLLLAEHMQCSIICCAAAHNMC
jgi:hypothetical protein